MEYIFNKILEVIKSGQVTALRTVVSATGSTPLKAGARMIVWEKRIDLRHGGRRERAQL